MVASTVFEPVVFHVTVLKRVPPYNSRGSKPEEIVLRPIMETEPSGPIVILIIGVVFVELPKE